MMVQAVQIHLQQIQMINKIKHIRNSFYTVLKNIRYLFELSLKAIKENRKPVILILLVPFSESKAMFYNVNKRVSWYLFSNHERQLCMVVEDYCNIVIFGVIFWFLYDAYKHSPIGQASLFLFILNALDLIHLGLYDMQGFIIAKILLAWFIYYKIWSKLKHSY